MSVKNVRVEIPTNPTEILQLAQEINAKHVLDGATSPLKELNDYKWEETGVHIAPALQQDALAKDYQKKMEEAFKERDKHLAEITKSVKASRDLLLSINVKNQKILGKWGFVVHDAVKSKSRKKAEPIGNKE